MSWVKQARRALARGESVTVRPHGGSMRGRIESGDLVRLVPASVDDIQPDDIVFVRWKGNYLLHLALKVESSCILIGNNLGKINGWVRAADALGKVNESTFDPLLSRPARRSP